jgi:predicted RNA binding protein YcfA (HicA-like mRNA interferase family)
MKTKLRKFIESYKGGSRNLDISKARKLLKEYGFEFKRQKGSHEIYYNSEIGKRQVIQEKDGGQIKRYQVKQIINKIEEHYGEL